ncbi:MAG: hypothetical protein R3C05_23300 [Pirellulaceae bacterium]
MSEDAVITDDASLVDDVLSGVVFRALASADEPLIIAKLRQILPGPNGTVKILCERSLPIDTGLVF